jgi:hypothetical protein
MRTKEGGEDGECWLMVSDCGDQGLFALIGGNGKTSKKRRQQNKKTKNINRHGLRPMRNKCHLPDPPLFSLQTTFQPSDNPAKKFRPLRNSLAFV